MSKVCHDYDHWSLFQLEKEVWIKALLLVNNLKKNNHQRHHHFYLIFVFSCIFFPFGCIFKTRSLCDFSIMSFFPRDSYPFRSSRPEVFCRKGVLKACNFIKKRLWHRCFPVNFAKFLRTLFLTERLRWMLLSLTLPLDKRRFFFQVFKCKFVCVCI